LGFCPEQVANEDSYRFLGIISKNREEWAITNIACMRASITIIPFFESLGSDGIAFILNQTELTSICFEKRFFEIILKQKREGNLNFVKNFICFDSIDNDMKLQAAELGFKIFSF
jgi:long-chain acyl-CoA synthetase